jgi:hypothetical protein
MLSNEDPKKRLQPTIRLFLLFHLYLISTRWISQIDMAAMEIVSILITRSSGRASNV